MAAGFPVRSDKLEQVFIPFKLPDDLREHWNEPFEQFAS